jgi:inorganic pyrophosphatase
MVHLWHDIELGKNSPNVCTAVVEINSGCRNKFEIHKKYGVIKLDRVLQGSSIFPFNYGFFPQTYAYDDDPLDVLVLGSTIIYPGCIVDVKPIGVIQMTDQGKVDSKIVTVAIGDISVSEYNEMSELPDYKRRELKRFYEEYKILENKEVVVGESETAAKAKEIITACSRRYWENLESLKK